MNDFKIGQKVIFKEDYTDLIKKGSIAKVTGFWNDGIEFKIINGQKPINGVCLYSRVKKLKNKNTNKITASTEIADLIDWLKNTNVKINECLEILNGTNELKDSRDEFKKEKLENLPLEFKFKHNNYSEVIHYCYKKTDHIIVSWINKKGNPEAYKFKIEECLSYINKGHWILID